MRITIIPFEETYLDDVGRVLARRHQANRAKEQALPVQCTDPLIARGVVEKTWRTAGAKGVVALEQRRVAGYLIGVPKIESIWGRSMWVPPTGSHAESMSVLPGHNKVGLYKAKAAGKA